MICARSRIIVPILICGLFVRATPAQHKEPTSREDREHFVDDPERHEVQFDHTAFLGEDRVKEFSKLEPEESLERLKQIIKRIDKDGDGKVSQTEMKNWISNVANTTAQRVTDKRWAIVNPMNKDSIEWEEYTENTYGPGTDRLRDPKSAKAYKVAKRLDQRRWKQADLNQDRQLDREEFKAFLHPEDYPHMKETMIDDLLDTVDQDADGQVSQREYLDDVAKAYRYKPTQGVPEPDWLVRERDQFTRHRDMDGDGKLSRVEVGEWILPKEYDPVDAEVQHLYHHADSDQDGKLTEEEILEKRHLFVSSQATNFGDEMKLHEEF